MNSPSQPNRQELFTQLQNAIALRSAQDQVLWTILGFFGATTAVLLSALFQSGRFPDQMAIAMVVVLAGILLCLAWNSIQARALGHIRRHELLIESIERELRLPPEIAVFPKINVKLYDEAQIGGTPARTLIAQVGWFALVLWAIVALVCVAHYRVAGGQVV